MGSSSKSVTTLSVLLSIFVLYVCFDPVSGACRPTEIVAANCSTDRDSRFNGYTYKYETPFPVVSTDEYVILNSIQCETGYVFHGRDPFIISCCQDGKYHTFSSSTDSLDELESLEVCTGEESTIVKLDEDGANYINCTFNNGTSDMPALTMMV